MFGRPSSRADPTPRDARRSSGATESNRAEGPRFALRDALRPLRVSAEPNERRVSALGAGDADLPGTRTRVVATRRTRRTAHPPTAIAGRGEHGLRRGGGRATPDGHGICP